MPKQQTYNNHTRWYPLFHFVVMPIFVLNLSFQVFRLYQEPGLDRAVWVVVCLNFILFGFAARLQALKAQDRVIRLEEDLRYSRLLSEELRQRAARDLRPGQMIALRFAPDAELNDLVSRTLNGEFEKNRDIKLAVKEWRPDLFRV